jgi:hypothetical protein
MTVGVSRLKVDDEEFLVASMIDRCPKLMMLRELMQNAFEAAALAPPGRQRVVVDTIPIDGIRKLRIWNSGPGMDEPQLYRMCDLSSSIGKLKGLDQHFGLGAKVASLPSNHLGMRYRSCHQGLVHEMVIGKRDGIYGRVKRSPRPDLVLPGTYQLVDIVEVTEAAQEEGRDLSEDWTEVVLFGMRPEQDTAEDPYDGDPPMRRYWLPLSLYNRFFRIPDGIDVLVAPDFHWHSDLRRFVPLASRALTDFRGYEAVRTDEGPRIHYFYDPTCPQRPWENASSEGAIQTAIGQVGIVHRDEIYGLTSGSPWAYDAPNFGITFGAGNISVLIELPDDYPALPDSYRQSLHHQRGDQAQLTPHEFAALVRAYRPQWLIDQIDAIGGPSSAGAGIIKQLGALSDVLGLDALPDTAIVGGEAAPTDLAAKPGATQIAQARQTCGFDIILLRDEQDINNRWLLGRAACFYPATKQLFVNTHYKSIAAARKMLGEMLADVAEDGSLYAYIDEVTVDCLVKRVGRALLFGISKHLDHKNWHSGHIEKAMSPEALSIAADDLYDVLPWAEQEVRKRITSGDRSISETTMQPAAVNRRTEKKVTAPGGKKARGDDARRRT